MLPKSGKTVGVKVPKKDISVREDFDFQNWEPMSLKAYEESSSKIKRNNKLYITKLPVKLPNRHLIPPKNTKDPINIKESVISQTPQKETSAPKHHILPTTPPSSIIAEYILTQPSRSLTPPDPIPTSQSKIQENILKYPISVPISRQGSFVGNFPAYQSKSKPVIRRKGSKPPPPPPFGPPPSSVSLKRSPPPPSFPPLNYVPPQKPFTPFTFKKAVPEEKVPTKAPMIKKIKLKPKRKAQTPKPIPISGKTFCFLFDFMFLIEF